MTEIAVAIWRCLGGVSLDPGTSWRVTLLNLQDNTSPGYPSRQLGSCGKNAALGLSWSGESPIFITAMSH